MNLSITGNILFILTSFEMMIDNLQTLYPASPVLAKFIYCYYVIESKSDDFHNTHYSFPHVHDALSIYSNGQFFNGNNHIKITGNDEYAPFSLLQGRTQAPLQVELQGCFSRITVLFKPLGLNHFIRQPLGSVLKSEPVLFTEWESEAYSQLQGYMFSGASISKRIAALESFLLSIYEPIDLSPLDKAIKLLADFDKEINVKEIVALVNMSGRSFNRLFQKHMGVSPVAHRQIARFRHSLENKMFNERFLNLTETGYGSNLYDQSYFNKLYKQFSGSNPKAFFKNIEQVGDTKLVFQYL